MEPGDSMVTGTVRETGAMPLAQIVIQPAETPVAVHGDLRDEIGNLIGAEVRVWGPVVDNQPPPPPRAIDVRGYEVLSVGGSAPIVGNLIEEGGRLFLVSGTRVELATIPDALRSHIGAKVWIVGVRQGETVSVQSFGVIRN